jgi:hypothetical protein
MATVTRRELEFMLKRIDESFETLKDACERVGEAGKRLHELQIVLSSMLEKRA